MKDRIQTEKNGPWNKTNGSLSKQISTMWHALSRDDDDYRHYVAVAEADKKRWEQEMAEWELRNKRQPSIQPYDTIKRAPAQLLTSVPVTRGFQGHPGPASQPGLLPTSFGSLSHAQTNLEQFLSPLYPSQPSVQYGAGHAVSGYGDVSFAGIEGPFFQHAIVERSDQGARATTGIPTAFGGQALGGSETILATQLMRVIHPGPDVPPSHPTPSSNGAVKRKRSAKLATEEGKPKKFTNSFIVYRTMMKDTVETNRNAPWAEANGNLSKQITLMWRQEKANNSDLYRHCVSVAEISRQDYYQKLAEWEKKTGCQRKRQKLRSSPAPIPGSVQIPVLEAAQMPTQHPLQEPVLQPLQAYIQQPLQAQHGQLDQRLIPHPQQEVHGHAVQSYYEQPVPLYYEQPVQLYYEQPVPSYYEPPVPSYYGQPVQAQYQQSSPSQYQEPMPVHGQYHLQANYEQQTPTYHHQHVQVQYGGFGPVPYGQLAAEQSGIGQPGQEQSRLKMANQSNEDDTCGLVDLRTKYEINGAYDMRSVAMSLRGHWPEQTSWTRVEPGEPPKVQSGRAQGLAALLVVIRRLYCCDAALMDYYVPLGEKNKILKLAWSDMLGQDIVPELTQIVLGDLGADVTVQKDLSFRFLHTHELMKPFWSKHPMRLFAREVKILQEHATGGAQYRPRRLSPQRYEALQASDLTQWDGKTPLSERMRQRFESIGKAWYLCNFPTFIRVRYSFDGSPEAKQTFTNVRSLKFAAECPISVPDSNMTAFEKQEHTYELIACVLEGDEKDPNQPDLVRTYDLRQRIAPFSNKLAVRRLHGVLPADQPGQSRRIGDGEGSCVLFYRKSDGMKVTDNAPRLATLTEQQRELGERYYLTDAMMQLLKVEETEESSDRPLYMTEPPEDDDAPSPSFPAISTRDAGPTQRATAFPGGAAAHLAPLAPPYYFPYHYHGPQQMSYLSMLPSMGHETSTFAGPTAPYPFAGTAGAQYGQYPATMLPPMIPGGLNGFSNDTRLPLYRQGPYLGPSHDRSQNSRGSTGPNPLNENSYGATAGSGSPATGTKRAASSSPSSSSSDGSRKKAKKGGKTKEPTKWINVWIAFRNIKKEELKLKYPGIHNRQLSKMISPMWHALDKEGEMYQRCVAISAESKRQFIARYGEPQRKAKRGKKGQTEASEARAVHAAMDVGA
ncbi:hypothetical protein F4780DRAFT_793600 [Xylariomycetidae sp. FL0641]|nr:hypothetical protein F4780DRAFT_793600 [Xylariomycetidae sp. FL0641]